VRARTGEDVSIWLKHNETRTLCRPDPAILLQEIRLSGESFKPREHNVDLAIDRVFLWRLLRLP